jgi:hypothetical protein
VDFGRGLLGLPACWGRRGVLRGRLSRWRLLASDDATLVGEVLRALGRAKRQEVTLLVGVGASLGSLATTPLLILVSLATTPLLILVRCRHVILLRINAHDARRGDFGDFGTSAVRCVRESEREKEGIRTHALPKYRSHRSAEV